LGPCVVERLRQVYPDARLVGLDTGYFATCLLNRRAPLPERILNRQDFVDIRDVRPEYLAGVDVLVHLAAISNDPMGRAFAEVTSSINEKATVRLAQLARQAGATRFVFASSCSVYGLAEEGARTEQSAVNPLTTYALSKVNSEKALAGLAGPDFVVTCLRFATACGMSPRLRLDLVLNDFVVSAIASRTIRILSDGTPWRPLIDVVDMARAIEWAIQRDPVEGGEFLTVNTGSTAGNYRVRDLAEAVASHIPGAEVQIDPNAAPDQRSYKVDFSLYRALAPRHQPSLDLFESIERLKSGLAAVRLDDEGFRASLTRLHVLSSLVQNGELTSDLRWQTDPDATLSAAAPARPGRVDTDCLRLA